MFNLVSLITPFGTAAGKKGNMGWATKNRFFKYFWFSGRASRSEIWKMALVVSFLPIIPMILFAVLIIEFFPSLDEEKAINVITLLSALPFYYIVFATVVRRMHDLNWKGWWVFLFPLEIVVFEIGSRIYEISGVFYWWMWVFVPVLICCHLLLIYGMLALFLAKGTEGPNNYGEDPLKS